MRRQSLTPPAMEENPVQLERRRNSRILEGEINLAFVLEGGAGGSKGRRSLGEDGEPKEYINFDQEDQMEIQGFAKSISRTIITWFFILVTAGILRLVFHWWPRLMLYATHVKCPMAKADTILAVEHYQMKYKRFYVKPVRTVVAKDMFKYTCASTASVRKGSMPPTPDKGSYCTMSTILSAMDLAAQAERPGAPPSETCILINNNATNALLNRSERRPSHPTIIGGLDRENSIRTVSDSGVSGVDSVTSSTDSSKDAVEMCPSGGDTGSFRFMSCCLWCERANAWVHRVVATSVRPSFAKLRNVWSRFISLPGNHTTKEQQQHLKTFTAAVENDVQANGVNKLLVPRPDGTVVETDQIRYFSCKKLRYIWDSSNANFYKLQGLDGAPTDVIHQASGLSPSAQYLRQVIYGLNEIKVEVQSITKLLFLEVLNPFYVFQIFSVALWMSDNYHYYATAIIIMSAFGIISTIVQTRQNQKKLRMTVQSHDVVTVCRETGEFETLPTEMLVPGDVIIIPPHGCLMNCDAALLTGNCIVNESMLTGESVPVTKIPLPNRDDVHYNAKEHARHTLFCGTQVLQTRYYGRESVRAVILRTGFLTAKGNLVRSIIYPPPVDYKFENDSYKFVAVLACIALVGFINSILTKLAHGESLRNIIVDSLDLITIVVPPALPAAMTVGRMYAQRRLQKQDVYCISPRAINVSGSINCVCFDKTGTLTEEGLDLWGVIPMDESHTKLEQAIQNPGDVSSDSFLIGMAACHSLTRIDGKLIGDPLDLKMFEWTNWLLEEPGVAETEKFDIVAPSIVRPPSSDSQLSDNKVQSDPKTPDSGEYNASQSNDSEIGIIRQFPFSSSLQRMSVITRRLGATEFELYAKGSPEMISSLALPHTIPDNFSNILEHYTQQGYRVIALGHRTLPKLNYAKVQRVVRDEVESELTFMGLIIMENRLKPETTGVIRVLKNANIRSIMVTGDNMLTAISVGRECGMLDPAENIWVLGLEDREDKGPPQLKYTLANKMTPMNMDASAQSAPATTTKKLGDIESPGNKYQFACTGHIFSVVKDFYPEILPRLLVRGAVFARMSPEQKQQLVELLQGLGYFVGMCGDGANDCGALKAAHAGISLSEAESSVASPFTSKEPNIRCVPQLIREGRAALVTSFGIFKYMAVYSMTQFITVSMLYTIGANLTDFQFLYIDLFLISIFAVFFGKTRPYDGPLEKRPPSASLVSVLPIVSIVLHILTVLAVQFFALFYVKSQEWFTPFKPEPGADGDESYACYENYSLFAVSGFQYVIMAIVFSQGKPYRQTIFTNPGLLGSLLAMTGLTIYLLLWPDSWPWIEANIFGYHQGSSLPYLPPDMTFRIILLLIAAGNFVVAMVIEHGIVNYVLARVLAKKDMAKTSKAYIAIDKELNNRVDWPPASRSMSVGSNHYRQQQQQAQLVHVDENGKKS